MFSRSDAESLREQLAAIDFEQASAATELLTRYKSFYGLDLDTAQVEWSYHIGNFGSADFQLVCQYFKIAEADHRGTVFLLHGYYDHAGLFSHLIRHCLQNGLSVVIFDMPGHGLSSGPVASIDSFADYCESLLACLTLAQEKLPKPWHLLGQSTGGAIIMDSLLHHDLTNRFDIGQYVLLCPLLYSANWRWSRISFYLLRNFVSSIARKFAVNSHDEKFLYFLKNTDALQSQILPVSWINAMVDYHNRFLAANTTDTPLHIIQGTGDTTVDWQRNMQLISEKFPQSDITLISDARHHLANEAEAYRREVFERISGILI
ncbi:MAG: alpha/beta hydrolase [Pseudomonadales bacterium]|nr:alpha/beta hydrolase [Pseudomonadales bacterium]